jgi:hypothetical protein
MQLMRGGSMSEPRQEAGSGREMLSKNNNYVV